MLLKVCSLIFLTKIHPHTTASCSVRPDLRISLDADFGNLFTARPSSSFRRRLRSSSSLAATHVLRTRCGKKEGYMKERGWLIIECQVSGSKCYKLISPYQSICSTLFPTAIYGRDTYIAPIFYEPPLTWGAPPLTKKKHLGGFEKYVCWYDTLNTIKSPMAYTYILQPHIFNTTKWDSNGVGILFVAQCRGHVNHGFFGRNNCYILLYRSTGPQTDFK